MNQPQFMMVFINILPCWAAKSQSFFSVEGRIISSYENLPLGGASISIKNKNESVGANKEGRFVIDLEEIPATLVFSAEGFIKQEITITPPPEAPLLITMTNYRLKPEIKPKPENQPLKAHR